MLVECGDIDPKRNAGIKFYEHATSLKIAHRMNIKNLHPDHKLQHNLLNLRKKYVWQSELQTSKPILFFDI